MMSFPTTVNGIPCLCEITDYSPAVSAAPHAAHAPEGARLDFRITDRKGYKAPWLEKLLDKQQSERIEEEIHLMREAEIYEAY